MVDNDSFHSRLGSDVPERWVDLDTRPWRCIEYSRLFRFARGYDSHDVHILGDPVCATLVAFWKGKIFLTFCPLIAVVFSELWIDSRPLSYRYIVYTLHGQY